MELPQEIIEGRGVRLRPLRDSDTGDVAVACNDPLTRRFLPMLPDPYTLDDARWWIREGAAAARSAGGMACAIADPATDRLMGGTGINRVLGERAQGEVGYWVAPWARRRGAATAATVALSEWAFRHGFARLELLTEQENVPSQRVALAAGYQREGVRRNAGASRDGSRHDLVAYARLATDPPGPAPRRLPDLPGHELTDGVVRLRPLGPQDAEQLYALRTLPDVATTSLPPSVPSLADVRRACALAANWWLAGERADLVILDAASGGWAGEIGVYHGEPVTSQAMVGYALLPEWRGRGYATRALRLVAAWALGHPEDHRRPGGRRHPGMDRLVAGTVPANVASQRVLERAGFSRDLRYVLTAAHLASQGAQAAREITP